jgi:hypothetical protein
VDDCELDALEARDAVHDFVHGSVSADRDEQARASRGSLAGEVDEVARPLGEEGVAGQPALGREPRDFRPALPGRAVVGGRVDEEGGLANGRPQ